MIENSMDLSLDNLHDTDYNDIMAELDEKLASKSFDVETIESFVTDAMERNGLVSGSDLYDKIFNSNSYPGSKNALVRNKTYLAQLLEELSSEEKSMVMEVVLNADIKGDDPMFFLMLAMGKVELLLHKKPMEIGAVFDRVFMDFKTDWDKKLQYNQAYVSQQLKSLSQAIRGTEEAMKATSEAALDLHANSIQAAANTVIKSAALTKVSSDAVAITKAAFYVFLSMIIGGILATAIPRLFGSGEPKAGVNLTNRDIAALEWANSELGEKARNNPSAVDWAVSKEGEYARQFMVWNHVLLTQQGKNKICEQDAKKFGITLTLDNQTVNQGYCTLWVLPPEKRKYISK